MVLSADGTTWTATLANGVYYTVEVQQGLSFTIEDDASNLTLPVFVQWTDLDAAKNGFLGYPQVVGSGSGQWVSRLTPDFAPIFLQRSSNQPYLFATKFSGRGWGTPRDVLAGAGSLHEPITDFPRYEQAKCEVYYETVTYEVLTDAQMVAAGYVDGSGNPDESTLQRFVTATARPGAEYLTLPSGGFKYVDGSATVVTGGPGKIVPNYDISLTWHLVPRAAVGSLFYNPTLTNPSIDQCIGKVNAATFVGQAVGTLLLNSCTITPKRSTAGDRLYNIEYRFKFLNNKNPSGTVVGNQGLYQVTPNKGYYEVTTSGSTNLIAQTSNVNIYDYSDMTKLFKVPT